MPGQNVSWLEDRKLQRFEHRSTDTLPLSLQNNVFLTRTPNPYANHALASLAPHLGKGKAGPAPWKYGSLEQKELEKLEKLKTASAFVAFNDLLLEALEAVGAQVQSFFFLGRPDDFLWVPQMENGEPGKWPTEVHRLWVGHGQTWLADRPALGHVAVEHNGQCGIWWHGVPPMPADGPDGEPDKWSLTRVADLGPLSSMQLKALASAMDTAAAATAPAAAATAPAAQACQPTRPLPMMPVNIQPSAYHIGCRIRGQAGGAASFQRGKGIHDPAHAGKGGAALLERGKGIYDPAHAKAVAAGREQGGAACLERGKGIHDPAHAKAVAAGSKKGGKACHKAQGKAHGKPRGSCAACEMEQEEETPAVKRWGPNGMPVCGRHYGRFNYWKRAGKHAELADALRKAKAMDLDSDVEIVDSDSDVEIVGG